MRKQKSLVAGMMMQAMPIFVAAVGFAIYKADPELVYARAMLERAGVDASAFDKPAKVQSLNATYTGLANVIHR